MDHREEEPTAPEDVRADSQPRAGMEPAPEGEPKAVSGIAAMRAVTISREYGSGGGEIGARLARRLGWDLVDHEIVAMVAEKMGITLQEAAARDEHAESFFARMLSTMQVTSGGVTHPRPLSVPLRELQSTYHQTLTTSVQAAVEEGHVVIIGRGSQVLLAGRRDVLHVRIVAPMAQRITYVALREGVSVDDASLRIRLKDRDRMNYLRTQYHLQSNDPLLYDLTINTAVLGLDSVVELIAAALLAKSTHLETPEQELGPAAGQTRYAGEPADLRPPWGDTSTT
jgi:CMP/dCMP kinase